MDHSPRAVSAKDTIVVEFENLLSEAWANYQLPYNLDGLQRIPDFCRLPPLGLLTELVSKRIFLSSTIRV